jgi:hypothetical protein
VGSVTLSMAAESTADEKYGLLICTTHQLGFSRKKERPHVKAGKLVPCGKWPPRLRRADGYAQRAQVDDVPEHERVRQDGS